MHQFQALDHLVIRLCEMAAAPTRNADLKTFATLMLNAVTEAETLRSAFLQEAVSRKAKKELKLLLYTYQAIFTDISNKIFAAGPTIKKLSVDKESKEDLLQKQSLIQHHLLSFVEFLENHFTSYFDSSQPMPLAYANTSVLFFKNRLTVLKAVLININDAELMQILLSPLEAFMARQAEAGASYREFILLRKYITAIENIAHQLKDSNYTETFLEICINLNYTPTGFIRYFISKQRNRITTDFIAEEQKEEWQKILNTVSQYHLHESVNEIAPSIKSTIVVAIENERDYLAQIIASKPALNLPPGEKILQTPMSVSQLALFIRVLVDTGALKCSNQSLMLRHLAANITTTKSTAISPESLRVKYYDTDATSARILKDYIIRMMNQLRQY